MLCKELGNFVICSGPYKKYVCEIILNLESSGSGDVF